LPLTLICPVCRFSLDSADAAPVNFLSYLIASLQQRLLEFGKRTLERLSVVWSEPLRLEKSIEIKYFSRYIAFLNQKVEAFFEFAIAHTPATESVGYKRP
jgi:hypothetical protein